MILSKMGLPLKTRGGRQKLQREAGVETGVELSLQKDIIIIKTKNLHSHSMSTKCV